MFINYLPLMLVNMSAGLVLLAYFVFDGLAKEPKEQKLWVPGFAMTGLIALVAGLGMCFTWPLPGAYNIAFGEASVLFGILFVGAAFALGMGYNLLTVAMYAFFAGLSAVVLGIRIVALGMTQVPILAGTGYILTGLGGILATPALLLRSNRLLRIIGALVMLAAAALWAFHGYASYWEHLVSMAKWVPLVMRSAK